MSKVLSNLWPVLTLAIIVVGFWWGSDSQSPGTSLSNNNLERSEAVIQAKIVRKQAKLDGTLTEPQNPDGYADYRRMMRSHPEGTNTTEMLLAAKKEVERIPELVVDKDAGIWDWQWLGPGNIGGRIRAILLHPTNEDIMWIGSASGGIWKTINGGSSWYPLEDFLPSLAISAMVLDPNDPNILYAATGEGLAWGSPGAGIFKSYNGGDDWSPLVDSQDPDHGKYINDLIIHPTNSQILFAATGGPGDGNSKGQIWKTYDGGLNWDPVLMVSEYYFTDVELDPDTPQVVFASTRSSSYRSLEGGVPGSWYEMTQGTSYSLPDTVGRTTFSFGVGNDYVYASCDTPRPSDPDHQGEIWRSTNNGQTWELMSRPYHLGKQGRYDNVIWLEPGSHQNIMFGGIDLWSSLNGGISRTRMSNWQFYHQGGVSAHADQHVIVPHIDYGNGNATIFFGNDGGIQKSVLGFATQQLTGWSNLANNLGITQFYHADASPDGGVILGGTQDNDDLRFYRSQGIQNWYQADTGDGTYNAIDPDNPLTMYAAYIRLMMQRTYDGGNSYDWITNGLADAGDPDLALFVAPFALDKVSPNYLFAGGESIWRTANGGDNWTQSLGPREDWPLCSAVETSPSAGSMTTWVGYTDGTIWITENRGISWSEVDSPAANWTTTGKKIIRDIEISPHDPDVIAVVFSGYYSERVWLTTNGGQSWSPLPGSDNHTLPVVGHNCVTFHPVDPDWLYVGTDIGLFASEDQGQKWSVTPRYTSSEGPVYVEVSDLIWHSGQTLVAVTYGRGLYECQPMINVFVDISNNSGEEDGTLFSPFNTFGEGYNFIGPGSTMIISSGDYDENGIVVEKRITLDTPTGETAVIR